MKTILYGKINSNGNKTVKRKYRWKDLVKVKINHKRKKWLISHYQNQKLALQNIPLKNEKATVW